MDEDPRVHTPATRSGRVERRPALGQACADIFLAYHDYITCGHQVKSVGTPRNGEQRLEAGQQVVTAPLCTSLTR